MEKNQNQEAKLKLYPTVENKKVTPKKITVVSSKGIYLK